MALDALQGEVSRLWGRTGLGGGIRIQLQRYDDGSWHVEFVNGRYEMIATERGKEVGRKPRLTLEEAARWHVFSAAYGRALRQELEERVAPVPARKIENGLEDDGYSRWNWMALTIETMGRVSPAYEAWTRAHYAKALVRAPLAAYEIRNAKWPLPD